MEYMSINIFWHKLLDVDCSVLPNEKEMTDFSLPSRFPSESRNRSGLKCSGSVNMSSSFMTESKHGQMVAPFGMR